MATNLVILESPSKALTVKGYLGTNYKVIASIGHVRDLPKSTLGVDIENDFEAHYINIRGKGDLIKEIRKSANCLKLTLDDGLEGRVIVSSIKHDYTADELLEIVSADEKLCVCFDVNHLLQGTHADFLEKLGNKIVTLHISDYDFKDEKHWLPGEGDIDWQSLYQGLVKVGYDGMWLYELGQIPPRHLHRDRNLTFGDYVGNAKTIFAGQTPAALGQRLV